jgi:hypothetical protein
MLTGLVITLASLASGLAQNETLLIGGRIGQGVGAVLLSRPPVGHHRYLPRRGT